MTEQSLLAELIQAYQRIAIFSDDSRVIADSIARIDALKSVQRRLIIIQG